MQTITVSFSTTKRFSSAFLRWAQRCRFSHVEINFGEYNIGARSTGVEKYTDHSHLTDITLKYITVTDEQYELFYKYLHGRIGSGYDWRAYLGFALFKNTNDTNRWFCSELLQEAFHYAGIHIIVDAPSYFTQPRDFWISPLLTLSQ